MSRYDLLYAKRYRQRMIAEHRCTDCRQEFPDGYARKRCEQCLDRKRRARVLRRQVIRAEALSVYGGSRCACCGETNQIFLTLDHIEGEGRRERKLLVGQDGGGYAYYQALKNAGWPPGLQVLCWNCNYAKYALSSCPHVQEAVA